MDFANNDTEHVVIVTSAPNPVSLHWLWKQNHIAYHICFRDVSMHLSLQVFTWKRRTFAASLSVRTMLRIVKGKTYNQRENRTNQNRQPQYKISLEQSK